LRHLCNRYLHSVLDANCSDQEILTALRGGEEAALELLYARYGDRVYNLALVHLQRVEPAEEVTQDVFLEVFRSAKNFRGESELTTWLYRITVNKARDHQRRAATLKRSIWQRIVRGGAETDDLAERVPDFDHPGVQMEKREDARRLFRAIHRLNDRQKTAVILCLVEELPRKEAAAIMQVTPKALEGLLHRAKGQLRNHLAEFAPGRGKSRKKTSNE